MLRFWLLAIRPKTLSAAVVPILVGSALAYMHGNLEFSLTVWALAATLFIQMATNLFNDAIDFKKGTDTVQRLGPKRMTQAGHLSYRQVLSGGCFLLVLAILCGIPLVLQGGKPILFIGLVSAFFSYGYTGGPYPLSYKGFGDLFVLIFFGLVAVGGMFFLHTGFWHIDALVAGLQVGMLATVLIAINNYRDYQQDRLVNKKTMAVRFGQNFAKLEIAGLLALSFLAGLWWLHRGQAWAFFMPLLCLPLAWRVTIGIWRMEPGPIFNRYLALASLNQLLFGLGLAGGLWL